MPETSGSSDVVAAALAEVIATTKKKAARNPPYVDSNRKFGVEVEFHPGDDYEFSGTGGRQSVQYHMKKLGLPCIYLGYTHDRTSEWKLVTDGSVDNGLELVSPVLSGREGLVQVAKALKALRRNRAHIENDCGLHVHIDAQSCTLEQMRRIVALWLDWEGHIYRMVPRHRRNNTYCMPAINSIRIPSIDSYPQIERMVTQYRAAALSYQRTIDREVSANGYTPSEEDNRQLLIYRLQGEAWLRQASKLRHLVNLPVYDRILQAESIDALRDIAGRQRYMGLNLSAFWVHGTVEFRLHHGSMNPREVISWIRFCRALVDVAFSSQRLPTPAIKTRVRSSRSVFEKKAPVVSLDQAVEEVRGLLKMISVPPTTEKHLIKRISRYATRSDVKDMKLHQIIPANRYS